MTLKECEDRLIALVEEIERVYHEFNPDGDRLLISLKDKRFNIRDGFDDRRIDISRSHNGAISRTDEMKMLYQSFAGAKEG